MVVNQPTEVNQTKKCEEQVKLLESLFYIRSEEGRIQLEAKVRNTLQSAEAQNLNYYGHSYNLLR